MEVSESLDRTRIWKFISLDRAEHRIVYDASSMPDFHNSCEHTLLPQNVIVPLLAKPIRPSSQTTRPRDSPANPSLNTTLAPVPNRQSTCGRTIEDLPVEILTMIFERLPPADAVSLALTNQYFWDIGEYQIKKRVKGLMGSWANTRLVRFSGWSGQPGKNYRLGGTRSAIVKFIPDDEKVFDPEPINRGLRPGTRVLPDLNFGQEVSFRPMLSSDIGVSFRGRQYVNSELQQLVEEIQVFHQNSNLKHLTDEQKRKIMLAFSVCAHEMWPTDKKWILRNLTTFEFIRIDALAISPDHVHGPFIEGYGVGHLLGHLTDYDFWVESLARGPWRDRGIWYADRFDIVTTETHGNECRDNQSWTDVTEEIVPRFHARLSQPYPDWKEFVTEELGEVKAQYPYYFYSMAGLINQESIRPS